MKRTVFPPVEGDNQSKYGTTMFPPFVDETASIAYDGTLLPAGTGADPTKRYLKDKGKDKNHVLVESGQGKFFNGSNQYINTGVIPNQAEGTLVTRFTCGGSNARCIAGFKNSADNGMWIGMASGLLGISFGSIVYSSSGLSALALVSGSSYHISVRYSGLNIELIVNGVTVKTMVSSAELTGWLPIYIGARNNNGTADVFHNSVIDETYYYDVALTDAQISTLYQYPEKIKEYNGAIVPDIGNEANCKLFLPMSESNNASAYVYNVSVNPKTQLSIANFTASCVDSAKQLSYGAQCIAWKRDALGLPTGMSGGLSFDGGKSVKGVNTGWKPTITDSFVVEAIVMIKDGVLNQVFGTAYGANTVVGVGINPTGNPQGIIADKYIVRGIQATTPRHVVIKYAGTVGSSQMWIDGVELSYAKETAFTNPTSPFYIGSFGSSSQKTIMVGSTKVHKGTQYAKFNVAKAWAKAQKIISKLGA